jgi:hypothetical protein
MPERAVLSSEGRSAVVIVASILFLPSYGVCRHSILPQPVGTEETGTPMRDSGQKFTRGACEYRRLFHLNPAYEIMETRKSSNIGLVAPVFTPDVTIGAQLHWVATLHQPTRGTTAGSAQSVVA